MNEIQRQQELNRIFGLIAEELDVPASKYEDAQAHYNAVGDWLNAEGSQLAPYRPTIFPQGSFALGTAIKPTGDDHYDVDAVCQLQLQRNQTTQQRLKAAVGYRLKQNATYAEMLDPEGRRCWTLKYADASQFHIDILPCIPDEYGNLLAIGVPEIYAKHSICITDKTTWDNATVWPKSNPKGYAHWFKEQMRVRLDEALRIRANEKRASVQDIPDYEVRTPLQRAVQILKRHRDLHYNGDDDKPISIIITTLAAHAYNNEPDLFDALRNMLPQMRAGIELRDGVYWVPNPVNPEENFADKWSETPRKSELFFAWLAELDRLYQELLTTGTMLKVGSTLTEAFGDHAVSSAMRQVTGQTGTAKDVIANSTSLARVAPPSSRQLSRFAVAHREDPYWPVRSIKAVSIQATASVSHDAYRPGPFRLGNDAGPLPKGAKLRFYATTDVAQPFEVHWQIVNTGAEATVARNLRGRIIPGSLEHEETTQYRGMHWVECFIVKNGACVARSGEFVVNIA